APSSIDIVRPWFEIIRYGEAVPAKGTLKKSLLLPRWSLANGINIDYAIIFWEDIIIKLNKKHREKALKLNQPEEPSFIEHMLAICVIDTPVGMNEGTQNTSCDHLSVDVDSPEDDPVIVVDDSDEDKEDGVHTTIKDTSVPKSSSPSNSLPTELKDLPSKFNKLIEEVKGLKQQFHELEIELPGDLKEIPSKLEDFTKTIIGSSQPEGEHIKKDKGKKAMSLKDAKKVSTKGNYDDETTHVHGFMIESSKKKDLKKSDFVTEDGEHVYLTEKQISTQKKIEEDAKAKAARCEGEMRKEEMIDLLGPEVVNKYYNDKLQYNRYCDKMLNKRAKSRITNCDILTRKGPITLKLSVQYEDHPAGTVLNEPILGLDDHVRTVSSLLLAKIDKRNLNLLK
nr:hypothetical protein [Tanacetum cinerariifolium]